MDDVFKQYGVCEDVSDMIAKKVHEGHQKKINDHISVIIGWDPRFDYWTFGNFKPKSLFWPYAEPYDLERVGRVVLTGLMERYHTVFKKELKIKNMKPKLTKEEYTSYVLCGKKVFMMCSPVRWNRFMDGLDNKYNYGSGVTALFVTPLSKHLSTTTLSMNSQYYWHNPERMKFLTSEPDYDPVMSFIHKGILKKKHLISWLNKNGNPRKLTNKTKKQLWNMIMKLE